MENGWACVSAPGQGSGGRVLCFQRDGDGTWPDIPTSTFNPPLGGEDFGEGLAMDGNWLAIGWTDGGGYPRVSVFENAAGTQLWDPVSALLMPDCEPNDMCHKFIVA